MALTFRQHGRELLRIIEGKLESAQSFETDGERIVRIHVQRNPEKLAGFSNSAIR